MDLAWTWKMDYRFEQDRLDSFDGWPKPDIVSPSDLAAAGFYYLKRSDAVKCFSCSIEICDWANGDDPMLDHEHSSRRCRFVRKMDCGNVPIGVDPSTVQWPTTRSQDVCGTGPPSSPMEIRTETLTADQEGNSTLTVAQLGSINIGIPRKPHNPEYASYAARLQSFEDWPISIPQTKEELSDAGFYYTKTGDQTICYYCGIGLKSWEKDDDPWLEHAKWYPKCYYVLMVKGQEFIDRITGQHSSPTEEEMKRVMLPSYIKRVQPENPTTLTATEPSTSLASKMEEASSSSSSIKPSDETKTIDDARACKLCYSREIGVAFLPCGHLVACANCAPGIACCAVCRKPVQMTVRAFFS